MFNEVATSVKNTAILDRPKVTLLSFLKMHFQTRVYTSQLMKRVYFLVQDTHLIVINTSPIISESFFFFFQVKTCLSSSLLRSLNSNPADIECLRLYIIIPEALSLMSSDEMTPLGVSYAEGIINLQNAARNVLGNYNIALVALFDS